MFNYVFIFQIICLSATTNKLSNIQKQAEEYAALIMEELDPDDTGFIMVIITYKIILYATDLIFLFIFFTWLLVVLRLLFGHSADF